MAREGGLGTWAGAGRRLLSSWPQGPPRRLYADSYGDQSGAESDASSGVKAGFGRTDRDADDDIDEAQDLLCLEREPAHAAPHTRAVLSGLARTEVATSLPTELQVEVTSRCNLKCDACLRTHKRLAPDVDLTIDDFVRIASEVPVLSRVVFQLNGESLLSPDVFAMIREACRRGAHTILNTNGTLLDEPRRAALRASGLSELRVSLDGATAETVERMAGADIFSLVVEGVRAFVVERQGRSEPRVSLWMIANQETIQELPDVIRLAATIGVEEVYLQRLVVNGYGIAQEKSSIHGRLDARVREILGEAERVAATLGVALRASGRRPILESLVMDAAGGNPRIGCWRPWRSAVVTASKLVLPCCISSFTLGYDRLMLGDLSTERLSDVWNGERYKALRRGILSNQPVNACLRCGVDWSL